MMIFLLKKSGGAPIRLLLCCTLMSAGFAYAQEQAQNAAEAGPKPVDEMSTEELRLFIEEQQRQLNAVKKARDEQKAKQNAVQEALLERQEKLNEIVIELNELCSERKKLDPENSEPCLPDES